LQILILDCNNLTNVPKDIFKHNTQLKELYLANNKLTNLPEDIFRYNTQLEILSLSYNKLTELPEDIFRYNIQLKILYLHKNNFEEKLNKNIFRNLGNLEILYIIDLEYNETKNYKNYDLIEIIVNKEKLEFLKEEDKICMICLDEKKEELNLYLHEDEEINNLQSICKFIGCKECYDNLENKVCLNCKNKITHFIKI